MGTILETDVPKFIVKLGRYVAEQGISFSEWKKQDPEGIAKIAEEYLG